MSRWLAWPLVGIGALLLVALLPLLVLCLLADAWYTQRSERWGGLDL